MGFHLSPRPSPVQLRLDDALRVSHSMPAALLSVHLQTVIAHETKL